ncbi:hypothetical protein RUND412_000258 [Rhizina undulata]
MRRALPRITRSLPTIPPAAPRPQCLKARTFTTTPRALEEKVPFQEMLRRKLFRTPPPDESAKAGEVKVEKKPAAVDMTGYIEAFDGRELRVVGGVVPGAWEVDRFLPETQLTSTTAIHRAVHRAIVEVFTATLNGRPPTTATESEYTGPEENTSRVSITVSESGEARFEYATAEIEAAILRSAEDGAFAEDQIREYKEEEVYPELEEKPVWLIEGLEGRGWVELGLGAENGAVKFAVFKRVMQLTGIRIPDPEITQMKTVQHLLEHLQIKPKPKKLIDVLTETDLAELPNVQLLPSKIRPLDRERALGRARPFEKEFDYQYPFVEKSSRA